MEDALMPFILVAIVVLTLFVMPVVNMSDKLDDTMQTIVDDAATEFVDRTRAQGYITYNDYQNLIDRLLSTGNTYDIDINLMSVKYLSDDDEEFNAAYVTDSYREITQDLIDLTTGERYQMKAGDYLRIQIVQTSKNPGTRFKESFFGHNVPSNFVRYGGRVGNEDVI